MNESFVCHHCKHYPNIPWKVGDIVEFDPDPDDDDAEISHSQQGIVFKIKPKNKEVTIKLQNNRICSYFWDEISIITTDKSALYDDTQFKKQLLEKDEIINNIKLDLQKEISSKKKYKKKAEEEEKLRLIQNKEGVKHETLIKTLQQLITEKDEEINNMKALIVEKDEQIKYQQIEFKRKTEEQQNKLNKDNECKELIKQKDGTINYINLLLQNEQKQKLDKEQEYKQLIKQKEDTINDMNILLENEEKKRLESLDKDSEYQLKYDELRSNLMIKSKELEDEKKEKTKLITKCKREQQKYKQLESDLFDMKVKLSQETLKKERYEKKVNDYRTFANSQMNENKKLKEKVDEDQKENQQIVESVLQQNESERIQKEKFMIDVEQQKKQKLENQKQYETHLKKERVEKNKLLEEKENLLELNEKLKEIVEDEKNNFLQKEQEYKLLREKLEKLDVQYPEFWDNNYMTEDNYSKPKLIDMTVNGIHAAAQEVKNRFFQTVNQNQYEIIKIEAVQNQMLYDKHWNEKQSMMKAIGFDKLNERNLFHGTKSEQVMEFVEKEGFRKEFNRAAAIGYGTYLARDANYSVGYSSNNNGIHKMFQCMAICGESHIGNGGYTLNAWPKKPDGLIYDSLVNNQANPSIFVVHNDVRIYPMFVIHFRRK